MYLNTQLYKDTYTHTHTYTLTHMQHMPTFTLLHISTVCTCISNEGHLKSSEKFNKRVIIVVLVDSL